MSLDQNHNNTIEKIHSLEKNKTQEELADLLIEQQEFKKTTLEKNNIINFDQAVKNRQKHKDDELRKYVLNNTKSF
jgi:hypothetical protein